MLKTVFSFIAACLLITGYSQSRADRKAISRLKAHVGYLADDKLEGRRTGTAGEKLAYTYIEKQFKKMNLSPVGDGGGYIQAFEVYDGKTISVSETSLVLGNATLACPDQFFPFSFSANAAGLSFSSLQDPALHWVDLKPVLDENKTNPHFDVKDFLLTQSKEAIRLGKKACFFSNSGDARDELRFDSTDKQERLSIPVVFVKNPADGERITLSVGLTEKRRTGHNVIGFIQNNAAQTIVLGAHFDHLGYGEDHNSLYAGKTPQIHNGADDNASGTSALLELARIVEKSSLKKYNFLIAAFSGEELGLYGSKYLVEHFPIDIRSVNCMINMDMVGRLNDSTHGITIGGYGTSSSWGELVPVKDGYFNIKVDSAGVGPSDHTSFYRKDIPVLFFFTGTHMDYHKPSDDADKINYTGQWQIVQYIYGLLEKINDRSKLPFSKTKETTGGKSSFKVSLGIMPDYTFSGSGVLVDGVSEGKAAQKAGIRVGDVLTQLGAHPFSDVQQYMQALGKFNKGETTTVTVKRGNETLQISITF
jgi:hypothetical protein